MGEDTGKDKTLQTTKRKRLELKLKVPKLPGLPLLANRKILTVAAIVFGAVLIAALGWWGWSNSSLSKLSATADTVEGTVEYRLDDAHAWERVRTGMSFGEGAQLRTLEKSRASFTITGGSAVRLNSNSSMTLITLTRGSITVQNTGGEVYARAAATGHILRIQTSIAAYQSEKAAYRVFRTDTETGVEVYYGSVSILGKDGTATTAKQGERLAVGGAQTDNSRHTATKLTQLKLAADDFLRWNSKLDKKHFASNELGVLSDLEPPGLTISAPSNGLKTEAARLEIKGTTEPSATVLVNGEPTTNNNGQFSTEINLNEGSNSIEVQALDAAGNKTTKNITVTRITADDLPVGSITITGTGGANIAWELDGSSPYGFQLIWSASSVNPTHPDSPSAYYDKDARSGVITGPAGAYRVRACMYYDGACSIYSNTITAVIP